MTERASTAIHFQGDGAVMCPACEEPIGTAGRYCWNCDAPVENPVTAPRLEVDA